VSEIKLEFNINKKAKCEYYIKEFGQMLELNILLENLKIMPNKIEIIYIVDNDINPNKFHYILEYESGC